MTPLEISKQVIGLIPTSGAGVAFDYEAVRVLIEQAVIEDRARWHRRFEYIQNVLGPKPMCSENSCVGCQVEIEQALEAAKLSLSEMQDEQPAKVI